MKPGDLVQVIEDSRYDDSGLIGVVQWCEPGNAFELPAVGLLMEGKIEVYDPKHLEIINENR